MALIGNVVLEEKTYGQFQNQKKWKMNLLGLRMKHVILKICNILKSDTKFTHTISILFELQAAKRRLLQAVKHDVSLYVCSLYF